MAKLNNKSSSLLPHPSEIHVLISHQNAYNFCIWHTSKFLTTFFLICWASLEQIVTIWLIFEKKFYAGFCWGLDFNSPKTWFWQISWEAMGIWLSINFSGQILKQRLQSTIIFPKILRLRCQFENLAEIQIIPFSINYITFWITKSMLIPVIFWYYRPYIN